MSNTSSDDENRLLNFLIGLYPKGMTVTQMFENAKKGYPSGSEDVIQEKLSTLLEKERNRDTVMFYQKRNKNQMETIVKLTPTGIQMVWASINQLYQNDPLSAFSKIKKWVKLQDQLSVNSYNTLLSHEIDEYFDLYSTMVTPHTLIEILQHMAFLYRIDMDDDKEINKIKKITIEILNRGLLIELIKKEEHKFVTKNKLNQTIQKTEEYYSLTEDGLNGLYSITMRLKGKDIDIGNAIHKSTPNNFREILEDWADLPLKKIIVWWIIALLFSMGVYTFLAKMSLVNNQFYIIAYIIFIVLVSFSETIHQIKAFINKIREKKKKSSII